MPQRVEQRHCPIHGTTNFVQSSPSCEPYCELCLQEEIHKRQALMKKPTHEYVPLGMAEGTLMGVSCICNYRGFRVESYISAVDPMISIRWWLNKNDAFLRLFEKITAGDRLAIEKFELQDGFVIVHRVDGGALIFKLERISEEEPKQVLDC